MKRLRLLALVLALLAALAVVLLLVLRDPLRARGAEALRLLVEREVSLVLGAPLRVETLALTLWPPAVEVRGVTLGEGGAIGRVDRLRARVLTRTSWERGRPLIDGEAWGVALDLPALLRALPPPDADPPSPVPAFRVRLRIEDARLHLVDAPEPLSVALPALAGRIESVSGSGRLQFLARAAAATLQRGERQLALSGVTAAGGETDDGWRLRRVALAGDGLSLDGAPRDGDLALAATLDLSRLGFLADDLAQLAGTATIDGRLEGPLEHPLIAATVTVPELGFEARRFGAVRAGLRVDPEGLTVEGAQLRGMGGDVEASGALQFDEPLTYTGELRWSGLDVPEVARLAAGDAPAAAADGRLRLGGRLDPLRVEADGGGAIVVPGGAPPVQWTASARYAERGGEATVEVRQGAGNTANAAVRIAADGGLGGSLRVRVADPDGLATLAAIRSLPAVRGALEASATLGGTVEAPRLDGSLDGRGLAVVGVRVDSIGGRFAVDRATLQTDGIRAALGGGSATLRGRVALDAAGDNAWTLAVDRLGGDAVASLARGLAGVSLPIADGALHVAATANGPWPRVRLQGDARLDNFWLGRERIARAALELRAEAGRWNTTGSLSNRAGQRIALRASGNGDRDLVVDIDCEAWDLTALWDDEEPQMGGRLRAHAELRGAAQALNGSAIVSAEELVIAGRQIGTAQVDATATGGRWNATATALDGAVQVRAELRPDAGFPFTLEADWQGADFARLLTDRPELHLESSGGLRFGGRLSTVERSEGRIEIAHLAMTGGPEPITADTPLTIVCRAGRCQLDRLTLRSDETALHISGDVGFDGQLRLRLDGGGDLGLLELLGDPIESARGRFTVDATITSGAAGLNIVGAIQLEQAALDAGLPVAFTRTNGRLLLDGRVVRVEELQGRVGNGRFSVGGAIDLRDGPALTWQLERVGADPLPNLELELSGSGAVEGSWERLRVSGDIRIEQLLYDRNIELVDFLPQFNRALANAPRPPGGTEVELALTITAPGDLYIENNLARLEAGARLAISGTADRPVLDGRIEVLDGELFLRGRTFEFLGATVDFRPDLGTRAALNIAAESLIDTPDGSYMVGLRVTGTTAEPRVTLTSDDPSLTQTDIAALIAFGRTTAQMRQQGGSFSLSGAFGDQVGSLLAGSAEQVLPVDRIEFEPTFSTQSGAFEPQLKIGKDLTDDLTASVGQTFGVSARTRVELEYRLGPRVSIPLSWESQTETEAGAFAGGVRVRYEFWRATPFTLLGGAQ